VGWGGGACACVQIVAAFTDVAFREPLAFPSPYKCQKLISPASGLFSPSFPSLAQTPLPKLLRMRSAATKTDPSASYGGATVLCNSVPQLATETRFAPPRAWPLQLQRA
jgi:hypothetical protein